MAREDLVNRKQITLTLDANDLNEVRRLAKRNDRSVSYIINQLLRDVLRNPVRTEQIIKRGKLKYAKVKEELC